MADNPKLPSYRFSEFELIERIRALFSHPSPGREVVGIGDDAAAWEWECDRLLVTTCDMLVEDVHFNLAWITPRQLGRRAVAVNLSDLAAMGAEPVFLLSSLGIPSHLESAFIDELLIGLKESAESNSARISGGNLTKTDKLILDIFAAGSVGPGCLVLRKGARPGDKIYVSGKLGAGIGGLLTLKRWGRKFPPEMGKLVNSFLEPQPRVKAGQLLAASGGISAMIDISDGLSGDLKHLCTASGGGALIYANTLPMVEGLEQLCIKPELSPLDLALHGGDCYELLFTVKPDFPQDSLNKISLKCGLIFSQIGEITPAGLELEYPDGTRFPLESKSWDHFRECGRSGQSGLSGQNR